MSTPTDKPQAKHASPLKWALRILGIAVGAPIALFLLLAICIYLPPIQDLVKQETCKRLSQSLHAEVTCDRVRLAFPLDLSLNKALVRQEGDTLLGVGELRLGIRVLPLFHKVVELDEVKLQRGTIHSKSLLSDLQLDGHIGLCQLDIPTGYALGEDSMFVEGILLKNSDMTVCLSDTAAPDTTTSEPSKLKVVVHRAEVQSLDFGLHMPGDSMVIKGRLPQMVCEEALINLETQTYSVRRFMLNASQVAYHLPYSSPTFKGLDVAHIHAAPVRLEADSILYRAGHLSAHLAGLQTVVEDTLRLKGAHGWVDVDSVALELHPFFFQTAGSQLETRAYLPWAALLSGGSGAMDIQAKGTISKSDLLWALGEAGDGMKKIYPDAPLQTDFHLIGNVDRANIEHFQVGLGDNILLKMNGEATNLLSEGTRNVRLNYQLSTTSLKYVQQFIPASLHVPSQLLLGGKLFCQGQKVGTETTLHSGKGSLHIVGDYTLNSEVYHLKAQARQFPLNSWLDLPGNQPLTAQAQVEGRGFDPNKISTQLQAQLQVEDYRYDNIPLDHIQINAGLEKRQIAGTLQSNNAMLTAATEFQVSLADNGITGALQGDIQDFSLAPFIGDADTTHLKMHLKARGRMRNDEERWGAFALLEDFNIITPSSSYPVDSVGLGVGTSADSTFAFARSGDLRMRLKADGGLDSLLASIQNCITQAEEQVRTAKLNPNALKAYLPQIILAAKAGKRNPLAEILKRHNMTYEQIALDLTTRRDTGINGQFQLKTFRNGKLLLDNSEMKIKQDDEALRLNCMVKNTSKKNPDKFTAILDGDVSQSGFSTLCQFKDAKGKEGLHVGLRGNLDGAGGVTAHLFPETSVIAYRKFKVNSDNFLTLTPQQYILANLNLLADDLTGLRMEGTQADSINDISLSLSHVNIAELCAVLPYLPNMSGILNSDMHVIRSDSSYSASCDLDLQNFHYEQYDMGHIGSEFTFLPQDSDEYYLNGILLSNDQEVAGFEGSYFTPNEGRVQAQIDFNRLPCRLMNAFLPADGTAALDGFVNGQIEVNGPTSALLYKGEVVPDSLFVQSPLYGVNLKMEEKPIRIDNNLIKLDNHALYSTQSPNPLTLNGEINFSNTDNILIDLAFKAKNFMIVNAERTKFNVVFGKVYSDIDATIQGSTNFMRIRGDLKVLGNTNVTYVMKDTPLTVDEWLSGLVEFQDFSDTTSVQDKDIVSSGNMMMNLAIKINENSKIRCELSQDGNSYFDGKGGGNLTMKYLPSGDISLMGKFTIGEGKLKYELPFIPLKTFLLSGDNYISFTGNPYNPTLHLTALENTRAAVSNDNSTTRMVAFNVGVAITQTLDNMGLQFLIEAPEDMSVQNELATMSDEDKGKLAITMLATGMYLTASNKSSFKANNALNAFLQSEIQNIAGNALRTIDLSVGIEGATSSSGNAQTNYSFQFSKHLWNDRVTIVIGGKVSAGSSNASENQSFIDNISLEYKLDQGATKNLRLFYDHDSQDPLEGIYATAGAGFVLRSKSNSLGKILIFKPRRKEPEQPIKKPVEPAQDPETTIPLSQQKRAEQPKTTTQPITTTP